MTSGVRRPRPENGGAQGRSYHQQSQVMLQDRGQTETEVEQAWPGPEVTAGLGPVKDRV